MLVTLLGIGILCVKIGIVFGVTLGIMAYLTYAERKISGHIQVRYGPMRVGWHGWLQPIADGLKFFAKDDITPKDSDRFIHTGAPILVLVIAIIVLAVLPIGDNLFGEGLSAITDLNIGILFIFAVSSLGVYGTVMAGWASNNKWSLLGGLRSAAQMISYEVPLGLALLGPLILAGTLSMGGIVEAQGMWGDHKWFSYLILPKWFIFLQPLAFPLYMFCALAETNRLPFDLPEAESELVAGYHTEYSGMKFAFFFMGEYVNMMIVSAIGITAFLGGWHPPSLLLWLIVAALPAIRAIKHKNFIGYYLTLFIVGTVAILADYAGYIQPGTTLSTVVSTLWFLVKLQYLLYGFIWIRWTFPRLRYDQLMNFGWFWMLPLSLANVMVTGIIYYLWTHRIQ